MIKAGIIGGATIRKLKSYSSTAAVMPETESPTYTKDYTEKPT